MNGFKRKTLKLSKIEKVLYYKHRKKNQTILSNIHNNEDDDDKTRLFKIEVFMPKKWGGGQCVVNMIIRMIKNTCRLQKPWQ